MNSELQELVKIIFQVGKLSYLSDLSSDEIISLLTVTENFSKILRQILPLKKQEESREQQSSFSEKNIIKENDKDH
jgi:hypothetical protein